jgi:hypothetical protein
MRFSFHREDWSFRMKPPVMPRPATARLLLPGSLLALWLSNALQVSAKEANEWRWALT